MSWLDQVGNLLQRYVGASAQQPPANPEADFDHFSRTAPAPAVAQGLADAFRSDQTPPFEQMVGQLFSQADNHQRAGLLNTILGAAGPQIVSQVLGGDGQREFTPEQAGQIPPQAVQQMAAQAERRDPSVIDQVSGFFAQHPNVVKTLGAGALTAVLAGLAHRQARGDVLPASEDPYGDPADQSGRQQVRPASEDPYGDPADELAGANVRPASEDPYGDPADNPRSR